MVFPRSLNIQERLNEALSGTYHEIGPLDSKMMKAFQLDTETRLRCNVVDRMLVDPANKDTWKTAARAV